MFLSKTINNFKLNIDFYETEFEFTAHSELIM